MEGWELTEDDEEERVDELIEMVSSLILLFF